MERAKRIEIAKKVLDLVAKDEPEYGEESWETDIGRFIDKDRFELEKQKLFLELPQLIALSADIENNGDYYATDIAGKPILLVRGQDGKARAFLNACRHRGVQLAQGCGKAKRFTCPYHAWTYATDGKLIALPNREAFEPDQLRGLVELPCIEKSGMLLVHPQPDGHLDFDEFFGPMASYLEDFDIESYALLHEHRELANINWKHAVDGGLEAYHAPILHKDTFGTGGLSQLLHIPFGDHHALIAPLEEIVTLRDIPEEDWPHHCYFSSTNSVFPNTVIGGGEPGLPVLFFQRSEPADKPGESNYVFRLYGKKNPNEEQKAIQKAGVELFLKVAIGEDMPTQVSCQKMMEAGAVPTVVFGKREINLTRMHKAYDAMIGHKAEDAVAAAHGNPVRVAAE
ncbi:MAG TPA: Rieske (2Fe-2S) protein [Rhodospirillaceae bacterium]|nr:Rieske (2Fe-2S) protein [Candidatus Neomarinimicrobiota bacterium]HCX13764.1 Rieske (2Fe-2S) protein [Rhodospirillaceae bacterium]